MIRHLRGARRTPIILLLVLAGILGGPFLIAAYLICGPATCSFASAALLASLGVLICLGIAAGLFFSEGSLQRDLDAGTYLRTTGPAILRSKYVGETVYYYLQLPDCTLSLDHGAAGALLRSSTPRSTTPVAEQKTEHGQFEAAWPRLSVDYFRHSQAVFELRDADGHTLYRGGYYYV